LHADELAAVLWLAPGSCDGAVASHLVSPALDALSAGAALEYDIDAVRVAR
jgi:hypothetical protein